MPNGDGGLNFPTWKWLAGILIGVLIIAAGYSLAETRNDVRALYDKKMDKEQYYQDMRSLRDSQQCIADKLDDLIKMHMNDRKDK